MILEGFVLLGGGFLIDGHVHVAAHEGGDLGRDFHDRGGQHHGHDARREEHLVAVVVHEAAVHGGTGQHEGEFPDLREAHGGEDGDARGERADDAGLGDGDGLLLHGLQQHLLLLAHLVELVDAAHAAVRQHQRARLQTRLARGLRLTRTSSRHLVLAHRHRQTAARRRVAAHEHATCAQRRGGAQQLAFAQTGVAHHQHVHVAAACVHRHAAHEAEKNAGLGELLAVDLRAERVHEQVEEVRL